MRHVAMLGLLVAGLAPSTGWAQAMVEVPNAPPPPPPPPTVTAPHRGPSRFEVLIEATPGVAVPLGGSYSQSFGPAFTMDGHGGMVIWMHARRYALVPELSVGGTALTSPSGGFGGGSFSRVRGEGGLRVLVPLGHHLAVYPRVAVGGDYFSGSFPNDDTSPGSRGPMPAVATASSFLFEAGAGLVATIGRHVVLGGYVGVPVTPVMNVDVTTMAGIHHLGTEHLTAVELTASGVVAFRL